MTAPKGTYFIRFGRADGWETVTERDTDDDGFPFTYEYEVPTEILPVWHEARGEAPTYAEVRKLAALLIKHAPIGANAVMFTVAEEGGQNLLAYGWTRLDEALDALKLDPYTQATLAEHTRLAAEGYAAAQPEGTP